LFCDRQPFESIRRHPVLEVEETVACDLLLELDRNPRLEATGGHLQLRGVNTAVDADPRDGDRGLEITGLRKGCNLPVADIRRLRKAQSFGNGYPESLGDRYKVVL